MFEWLSTLAAAYVARPAKRETAVISSTCEAPDGVGSNK